MPDSYGIPDQLFGQVPGQFYAVVGRVTMLGALLEQRLLELLWAVDDGPPSLHAGKPVSQLMRFIEERLASQPDDLCADAREVLSSVSLVLEDRNAIVHSLWPEPTLKIAFSWRPRTLKRRATAQEGMQGEFVTRQDLRAVISKLVLVNEQTTALAQRFHSRRATSS
ncbi:hypothetical protein [Nocardioides aequoreus]|uniref:hypothetical protein n=1 Tax=Nocardioides aequoreus TaxID=397278 RepID=UPI0004C3CBD0|nr:hypothetical protein [Nocardioides aequoreus]